MFQIKVVEKIKMFSNVLLKSMPFVR